MSLLATKRRGEGGGLTNQSEENRSSCVSCPGPGLVSSVNTTKVPPDSGLPSIIFWSSCVHYDLLRLIEFCCERIPFCNLLRIAMVCPCFAECVGDSTDHHRHYRLFWQRRSAPAGARLSSLANSVRLLGRELKPCWLLSPSSPTRAPNTPPWNRTMCASCTSHWTSCTSS